MAPPKVGERIKELRERLRPHVSQEELADKIGVRSETISRWERGTSAGYYDEEVLERLADALGVQPEDIVGPPVVASPSQFDRFEARLEEVLTGLDELRALLTEEREDAELPGPPEALQPAESETPPTSEAPAERETGEQGRGRRGTS